MPRVETRGSQNKKITRTEKLKQEVFSIDHCVKKASIATTREESVIVTSQWLAAGSCIDDVTIGQHFESFGAVTV